MGWPLVEMRATKCEPVTCCSLESTPSITFICSSLMTSPLRRATARLLQLGRCHNSIQVGDTWRGL